MYSWKLAGVWMKTGSRLEVDWKQTGRNWKQTGRNWKQTGSKLEETGRNLKETGTKVVEMTHLSFQHHDVKDSSMKVSRFEKKNMQEIKTTKHF